MGIDSSLGLNFFLWAIFFWAIFDLGTGAEVWVESVKEEERRGGKRKRKKGKREEEEEEKEREREREVDLGFRERKRNS